MQLRSVSDGRGTKEKAEEKVQYACVDHNAVAPSLLPADPTEQLHELGRQFSVYPVYDMCIPKLRESDLH